MTNFDKSLWNKIPREFGFVRLFASLCSNNPLRRRDLDDEDLHLFTRALLDDDDEQVSKSSFF